MNRYDPDGAHTVIAGWTSTGDTMPVPLGSRWDAGGRNVAALVFKSGRPSRIDDYADAKGSGADLVRGWGLRSAVGVPISVAGRLWGVLVVGSRVEPLPGSTEARLASFTELAATAVANAEAQAEVTASRARIVAAADQARRRIEQNLHDGGQGPLITLGLQLHAAKAAVPPELGELSAQLDRAAAVAAGALDNLREIARGIHPAVLTRGGLRFALNTLARRCPIPVDLRVHVNERLPEPVEVSAYYFVAEALTNAAKHAGASAADVEAELAGDLLRVTVRDDGVGGASLAGGSGLAGLKDRVEALGGQIVLHSPPGAGTSLRAELPLTATSDGVASH
jgi:signal transduction histidine kinase